MHHKPKFTGSLTQWRGDSPEPGSFRVSVQQMPPTFQWKSVVMDKQNVHCSLQPLRDKVQPHRQREVFAANRCRLPFSQNLAESTAFWEEGMVGLPNTAQSPQPAPKEVPELTAVLSRGPVRPHNDLRRQCAPQLKVPYGFPAPTQVAAPLPLQCPAAAQHEGQPSRSDTLYPLAAQPRSHRSGSPAAPTSNVLPRPAARARHHGTRSSGARDVTSTSG